jgi:hypothetical protein
LEVTRCFKRIDQKLPQLRRAAASPRQRLQHFDRFRCAAQGEQRTRFQR